ncbi:MAG TPA: anti-sigma factor [Cytophagaceae bacterium]|jgi:anti-sigma-K factor RskA|nr:anti-sigma factor [Cytophagaceae bacterium]
MNIKEYISSGILETFVFGGLSAAEAAEVEAYARQYPEVRAELDKLESQLENIALSYSKTPAPSLKSKIASSLDFKEPEVDEVKEKEVKIVQVPPFYRQAIAASVALAIISASSAGYFWNKWQDAEGRVLAMASEKSVLANNVNLTKQQLDGANNYLSLMQDSSSVLITLKGSALSPLASAKVLWNKSTHEVYLGGLTALPTPSAEQQYQLWAIVDGKPVDAGVFDLSKDLNLQQLKKIEGAQAFAVTVEKKGGSIAPTLTALYLIGNV